jgi:hypothetical protein
LQLFLVLPSPKENLEPSPSEPSYSFPVLLPDPPQEAAVAKAVPVMNRVQTNRPTSRMRMARPFPSPSRATKLKR